MTDRRDPDSLVSPAGRLGFQRHCVQGVEFLFLQPFFLPLIIGAFACAAFTGAIAESKGHDGFIWSIGGFFLGPLALLAAVGLPDLKLRKYFRILAEHHGAIEPQPLPPPRPPYEAYEDYGRE